MAIALDSTLYDAYLGIGTFKYWRYAKLKFISWLPFIPDDREEGISFIKKALEADCLSKYMAMHQLVYVLLDFDQKEAAIPYVKQIVTRYPESQFMWWAATKAYDDNNQFADAIAAYNKLNYLLKEDPNPNPNHIFKCHMKLAALYQRMADFRSCYDICNNLLTVLETSLPQDFKEKRDQVVELMELCTERLAEKNGS